MSFPKLEVGQRVFNRFQLEAVSGRGGHGIVWKARDEVLGETIALKILHPEFATEPVSLADFRDEVRRCRRLTHPHIVRVYDFHQGPEGAALAMEWVDGCSVDEWRSRRKPRWVAPDEILAWLPAACAALDYAHHEARIVHRDLKPRNILLPKAGDVRLVDFGIACRLSNTATRNTRLLAAGTQSYMSPQQLRGEDPAAADDIYSLGVTLYELVSGRLPFVGGDLSLQICERSAAPPSEVRRQVAAAAGVACEPLPKQWDDVLLWCLEKSPAARPKSASEVVRGLQTETRRPRGRRVTTWIRARKRGVGWWAAGAMLLAAGVVWTARIAEGPFDPTRLLGAAGVRDPILPGPWLVRGAQANGLIVHLPLDGDLQDKSGIDRHARGRGVRWGSDRAHRKGMAIDLSGRAAIELPLGTELAFGPEQPFTLAGLVRPETLDDAQLFGVEANESGAFAATIGLEAGQLCATVESHLVFGVSTRAPWPDAVGRWHHVALIYDGVQVQLALNGVVVASAPWTKSARVAQRPRLVLGWSEVRNRGVTGTVDEVRLYRRTLGEDALASLASEDVAPAEMARRDRGAELPWDLDFGWLPTRGKVRGDDDWAAVVVRDFGLEAGVAQWSDFARTWSSWPGLAAELAGWYINDSVYVERGETRVFRGTRYYYATRVDGVTSESGLVHAALGAHAIVLGSWHDQRFPVLARVPAERLWSVDRLEIGAQTRDGHGWRKEGGTWRRDFVSTESSDSKLRRAVALHLRPDWAAGETVSVRVVDHSGARWEMRVAAGEVSGGEPAVQFTLEDATTRRPLVRTITLEGGEELICAIVTADSRLFVSLLPKRSGSGEVTAAITGLDVLSGGMKLAEITDDHGRVYRLDHIVTR